MTCQRVDECGEMGQLCQCCGAAVKPETLDERRLCLACQATAAQYGMEHDMAE